MSLLPIDANTTQHISFYMYSAYDILRKRYPQRPAK